MSVQKLNRKKLSVGIVGAGPSGALMAYLLSKQGHNVYLLERRLQTERKVCGEYLCPKGVELLEQLNLFKTVGATFEPLYGMVLVSPENVSIPAFFPRPDGSERGLSVNRQVFDQKLLDLAVSSGIEFLNDTTVTKTFQLESGKWQVETDSGIFKFDLLIAADGRQSRIGHQLGHIKEINTRRAALHCFLPRKTERGSRMGEMHIFGNESYCGLDPVKDDEVNFSIVCNSERLKREKPLQIINETIKNSKRLSAMFDLLDEHVEIRIVTCLKNKNDFVAGNNLAYIGDAAGFIDPLTGEGIYNALLSSKLLADCMENAHDLSTALSLYKKTKRKLSFQKTLLNHFFQYLIRRTTLVNLTASFLQKSQLRANNFIGIIGNIHSPAKGICKMLFNYEGNK